MDVDFSYVSSTDKIKNKSHLNNLKCMWHHQLLCFLSCITSKTSFITILIMIIISCYMSMTDIIGVSWEHSSVLSCVGLHLMGLLDKVCVVFEPSEEWWGGCSVGKYELKVHVFALNIMLKLYGKNKLLRHSCWDNGLVSWLQTRRISESNTILRNFLCQPATHCSSFSAAMNFVGVSTDS